MSIPAPDCRYQTVTIPTAVLRTGRFGEPLEARIVPQRIKHRIEPEERRSERHARGQTAIAGDRQYFL